MIPEKISKNTEVAIIGFGRFGKVLAHLLEKHFTLLAYDMNESTEIINGIKLVSLQEALKAKTLFIAVPISAFSDLIKKIANTLSPDTTVIDVCSVKVHPVKVMQEFLPKTINIIASHPMFGPDSIKENTDLKMVLHKVRDKNQQYEFWKNFFEHQSITIIEMTPEEHDEAAAFSQGITHYVGRILEGMDIHSTRIDTTGFKKLLSVRDQTCHDTWQLYCDLQKYNPYSEKMQKKLAQAVAELAQRCPK